MDCKYKDIFGKPGQGVHSLRIFNIAIFDTVLTLLAAFLIGRHYSLSFTGTAFAFFILLMLSVVVHELFCVQTTLTKLLCKTH